MTDKMTIEDDTAQSDTLTIEGVERLEQLILFDPDELQDKEVKALCALARVALSRNEWRPIESAPKDGVSILAFIPSIRGKYQLEALVFVPGEDPSHEWMADSGHCYVPTHWQPLPSPPSSTPPEAGSERHAGQVERLKTDRDEAYRRADQAEAQISQIKGAAHSLLALSDAHKQLGTEPEVFIAKGVVGGANVAVCVQDLFNLKHALTSAPPTPHDSEAAGAIADLTRIATLTRRCEELERKTKAISDQREEFHWARQAAEDRATTLEAQVKMLREALKPFSDLHVLKSHEPLRAIFADDMKRANSALTASAPDTSEKVCKACHGTGQIADYVGLEMKAVGIDCDRCDGTGKDRS